MSSLPSTVGVKTRALGFINRMLSRRGWQLTARPAPIIHEVAFFAPPASCQIPDLGFLYELAFGRRDAGVVVEVGAFDGESFSNSSCLIDRGWQGVLVEPVHEFAALCRARHTGSAVVEVIEAACGAVSGSAVITKAGALSSMNPAQIEEYRTVQWAQRSIETATTATVSVMTLDELLSSREIPPGFEVLIVDVEGHEPDVLAGFDLLRWRPQMMIWELSDAHPDLAAARDASTHVGDSILDAGYRVLYKDAINTVFLRRDRDS